MKLCLICIHDYSKWEEVSRRQYKWHNSSGLQSHYVTIVQERICKDCGYKQAVSDEIKE